MSASEPSAERPELGPKRLAVVRQFVESLLEEARHRQWRGQERRDADRHPYVATVEIMPVDPIDDEPFTDKAVTAVARNLSNGGVALLYPGHLNWPQLALRMTRADGTSMLVLTQVHRVRPVGHNYYEIAGSFLRKLD